MAAPVIPPPPDYRGLAIPPPPDAIVPRETPIAPPSLLRSGGRGLIDPLTVAGKALGVLRAPVEAAFDVAGQADVAAGIKSPETAARRAATYANIPIPMAVAALTGGASLPAQSIIQMGTTAAMQEGGLEPKSTGQVVASGAMPFLAAGLGRLARGVGRGITRLIPSRFAAAQRGAQEAGEQVAQKMEPEIVTGEAFKGVRAAGAERIPATRLQAMLDDLEASIPKNPTSPGLKTARELMDQARESISGGQVDLGDLMRLRLDAGRSLKRAPEVAALYKGILGDLEQAGAAGGPGATLAMKALEAGRREHGTQLFRDLIEKASTRRSNLTGDLPLLDMAQLAKGVQHNKDQLIKQLGPDGVAQIEQFLVRFRALPPVDAYNFANKMALGGFGVAGFFGGGPVGALGAAGLYELLNNAKAVGRNPAELNRFLIMLGEGTRAGAGGMAQDAMKAKR